MRCRTLEIRLEQPFAAIDEAAASEFMESVRVRKVTASLREGHEAAWSVLVFFEESPEGKPRKTVKARKSKTSVPAMAPEPPVAATVSAPSEPAPKVAQASVSGELTPEEELLVQAIKAWRSGKASEEKVPPYCVAQNRAIEDIARTRPASASDLAAIKGFGPARIEKYGEELLALVASCNGKPAGR